MAQATVSCQSCTRSSDSRLQQSYGLNEEVETDPSHRYLRYPLLLGRGACKRVYKAFDQVEGIEVAWNQIELSGSNMDADARERLFAEIRVLKTLQHRNIMRFYDWWYDAKTATINFITEYFTSGNLRQYRKKHKHISEHAIKRWAFQILEGLMYLHAHEPPIVHRDLKCDNILVNGTSGQVKIADLGLASCRRGLSVVGTPEFMAPEIYDEVYDEKVDIYSFGMCMLELATLEYPYSECKSIPAIFRKVSKGIPPAALANVTSRPLHDFISTCIHPDPDQRPEALQLLRHDFFDSLKPDSPTGGPYISIPFGSCGNLQNLGISGIHSKHSNCASPRPKTLSCAECTAASRAAQLSASGQAELHANTHGSGGLDQCVSCGALLAGSTDGSSYNGRVSSVKQQGQQPAQVSDQPQGLGDAEVNFARGKSICVAALKRSEVSTCSQGCEQEEDSDDEVIVALEDVLTPHPEDLLDPATSHLHSTLKHAPSGCTIVSAPDCDLESLNLSCLLDPAGVPSSSIAGAYPEPSVAGPPHVLGDLRSTVGPACVTQPQCRELNASGSSKSVTGGVIETGAAAAMRAAVAASGGNAAGCERNVKSAGSVSSSVADGCASGTAWQREAGSVDSNDNPAAWLEAAVKQHDHNSNLQISATAVSTARPRTSPAEGSPADTAVHRSSGLHHSASSCSIHTQRGPLAAAGLLQMSPGVFVPTPPLLSKLLTKSSRPVPPRCSVSDHPCHKRGSGSDGLGPWEMEQQLAAVGVDRCQSVLLKQSSGRGSFSDPVLSALAAGGVHAVEQTAAVNQPTGDGLATGQGLGMGGQHSGASVEANKRVTVSARTLKGCIAASAKDSAGTCLMSSITVDGSVMRAALRESASYISTPDSLTNHPASTSVLGSGNCLVAAAVAPADGGLYGRIVVRRRFARNLQTAVNAQHRSKSL